MSEMKKMMRSFPLGILILMIGFFPLHASEVASDEFLTNYFEVNEVVLQSITDLEKGRDNTLTGKELKPDDAFRRVKGRLDGLSTKYRFESPPIVTGFEKTAWTKLADVLGKLVETTDAVTQPQNNFFDNETDFQNDLAGTISLFVQSAGFAMEQLPAENKEKLKNLLDRYPLAQRGEPYLGAILNETTSGTYQVAAVYPNSPAQQAGLQEGDLIQPGKIDSYLYVPTPISIMRQNEKMTVPISPIYYGFSKKPFLVGIANFENGTKIPSAPQFMQDLTFACFARSDSFLARKADELAADSTPKAIADYASSHHFDYVIFGKATRFDGGSWNSSWMQWLGSSGYVLHIEGDFRIYDQTGKLLAGNKVKAENTAVTQSDATSWLATGVKFIDALRPWLHKQINF